MSSGDWKELFDAGCEGDLALVEFHVKSGVNLNFVHPEYSCTPLVGAILAGQEAVALYMLANGAQPALYSALDDMTPIQAAQHVGLQSVVARLVELGVVLQPTAQRPEQQKSLWTRWWPLRRARRALARGWCSSGWVLKRSSLPYLLLPNAGSVSANRCCGRDSVSVSTSSFSKKPSRFRWHSSRTQSSTTR